MRLLLLAPIIVMTAQFASVASAQQSVVYDKGYGFLASVSGGNGSPVYNNKWGQKFLVDSRAFRRNSLLVCMAPKTAHLLGAVAAFSAGCRGREGHVECADSVT